MKVLAYDAQRFYARGVDRFRYGAFHGRFWRKMVNGFMFTALIEFDIARAYIRIILYLQFSQPFQQAKLGFDSIWNVHTAV